MAEAVHAPYTWEDVDALVADDHEVIAFVLDTLAYPMTPAESNG